jgi:tetratricopeptide (TPR) repeat protein
MDVLAVARHLAEIGRYADAERELRAALATAPDDVDVMTMLVFVLRQQQHYVDAMAMSDATFAAAPESPEVLRQRAHTQLKLLDTKDALETVHVLLRVDTADERNYRLLSDALGDDGDFAGARDAALRALAMRPDQADSLMYLAYAQWGLDDKAQAKDTAHRALRLEPNHRWAREFLAHTEVKQRRVRRSLRELSALAREDPEVGGAALLWPIESVLIRTRRYLVPAVVLVTIGALTTPLIIPRLLAAVAALGVAAYAARLLAPAGRLPWRALRAKPRSERLVLRLGVAVVVAEVLLLASYTWNVRLVVALVALGLGLGHLAASCGYTLLSAAHDAEFRERLRPIVAELRTFPAQVRQAFRDGFAETDKTN